jgi:type I restriction enzyme S subunit
MSRSSSQWERYELADAYWFQEGPGVRQWQFQNQGIKLLNVANITTSGTIDLDKTDRYLSVEEVESKYKHFLVDEGDLVIASSGISFDADGFLRTRGAFVQKEHLPLCMNTSTIRFKSKENFSDLRFLKYWLDSAEFRLQISRFVTGSAQLNFGPSHLKETSISLPPLPEQQRIATILDRADRLRRTRRYAAQLSETFLQAVFVRMFGDVVKNEMQWDVAPFEDVCQISTEMVDPRVEPYCNYLHIGGDNIESVTGNLSELHTAKQDKLISTNFLFEPNHILFSKIRPKLRKVAYPRTRGLCSADIYPISIITENLNVFFFLYFLRSREFTQIVEKLAESRTNIPKVNREELAEQNIPLPPLALQEKFARIVQQFERLRAQQREAERQAEHLFQTLLHRAFGGEG